MLKIVKNLIKMDGDGKGGRPGNLAFLSKIAPSFF